MALQVDTASRHIWTLGMALMIGERRLTGLELSFGALFA